MASPNSVKFTQAFIDKLKPPASGKLDRWDATLPGFGVRHSQTGRKSWLVLHAGAVKTIGNTYTMPKLDDAREAAREVMRTGIDPVKAKREQEAAAQAEAEAKQQTFAWMVERYIREYAERNQRPGTLRDTKRLLGRVVPVLGDKLAKEVNKADIIKVLDHIASNRRRSLKGHDGPPLAEARAVQVCLRTLFKWAGSEDIVDADPLFTIRRNRHGKPTKRSRVLLDPEIRAFWSGTGQLGYPFGTIDRLLLTTGARLNEIAGLRWTELGDPDEQVRALPDVRAKGGEPTVNPLSDLTLAILDTVPCIKGQDLLFTTNGTTPVSGFGYAKEALDRLMEAELARSGLTLKPWRTHDLRRTARTLLSRAEVPADIAERVLDHAIGGTRAIYDRWDFVAQKREAVAKLATMIEHILSGGSVVPLQVSAAE